MDGMEEPQLAHGELLQILEYRGRETQRLTRMIKSEVDLLSLERGEVEIQRLTTSIKQNVDQLNLQYYHIIKEGTCLRNMEMRMRAVEAQGKRVHCRPF